MEERKSLDNESSGELVYNKNIQSTFYKTKAQRQRHEKTFAKLFGLVVVGSESYNLIAKHLAILENKSHNLIEDFLTSDWVASMFINLQKSENLGYDLASSIDCATL